MERYFYEPGSFYAEHEIDLEDGAVQTVVTADDGFCVFDRKRGHTEGDEIAFCDDRDDAEKIVAALNTTVQNGS